MIACNSRSLLAAARSSRRAPALAEQPSFATPDAALAALSAALQAKDGDALANLLGPEHRADLIGGDPAQARQWMDELNVLVSQGAKLEPNTDGSMTVVMGRQDWPMPVPLVKEARAGATIPRPVWRRSTTGASAATS